MKRGFLQHGRTQGGVVGVNPPQRFIFYKNFIVRAKEINCFNILLLDDLSTYCNTTE